MNKLAKPDDSDLPDDSPDVREELSSIHSMAAQGFRSASRCENDGEIPDLDITADNLRRSRAEAHDETRSQPTPQASFQAAQENVQAKNRVRKAPTGSMNKLINKVVKG